VSPSLILFTTAKHLFVLETANRRVVSPIPREPDFHVRNSISGHNFRRVADACPRNPAAIGRFQADGDSSIHVSKTKPIVARSRSSLAVHKTGGCGPASANNRRRARCRLIARFCGGRRGRWAVPAMTDDPSRKRSEKQSAVAEAKSKRRAPDVFVRVRKTEHNRAYNSGRDAVSVSQIHSGRVGGSPAQIPE